MGGFVGALVTGFRILICVLAKEMSMKTKGKTVIYSNDTNYQFKLHQKLVPSWSLCNFIFFVVFLFILFFVFIASTFIVSHSDSSPLSYIIIITFFYFCSHSCRLNFNWNIFEDRVFHIFVCHIFVIRVRLPFESRNNPANVCKAYFSFLTTTSQFLVRVA